VGELVASSLLLQYDDSIVSSRFHSSLILSSAIRELYDFDARVLCSASMIIRPSTFHGELRSGKTRLWS